MALPESLWSEDLGGNVYLSPQKVEEMIDQLRKALEEIARSYDHGHAISIANVALYELGQK